MSARFFLFLTAVVFLAFGCWGFIQPATMVERFGITVDGPDGATLIRASYGGFLIGAGLIFGWCALSVNRARTGLIAVMLLTMPIVLSRLYGLLVDGASSPYHKAYLMVELAGIGLALIFLHKDQTL